MYTPTLGGAVGKTFPLLKLLPQFTMAIGLILSVAPATASGSPLPEAPPRISLTPIPKLPEVLSLAHALDLSLRHNPDLNADAWEIRAREARAVRAGLLPNPRLRIALEDFGGSGEHRGYNVAETTLMLSQLIELGGKRLKRRRLAASERDLALWDYESRRVQVAMTTQQAFVDVLAAQVHLQLAQKMLQLAERLHGIVDARVRAGEVSRLERFKSRVELARARLQAARARQQLVTARQRLAAIWGGLTADFERVTGQLDRLSPLPPLPRLLQRLQDNPDVARWATEMVRRQRLLAVAQATTIPDLTVRAGIRQYAENGDVAAVAVFQVPLFIFNDQRTRVQEAQAGLSQAEQRRHARLVEARRQLVAAYQQLRQAQITATLLKTEILPSAEAAFDAVREAYRLGKVGVLDLIDAQRTLFAARRQQVEAWRSWQLWWAALERLIGEVPVDPSTSTAQESS